MIPLLVVCAGLLADVAPETRAEYQNAVVAAGRDADAHVRLALWCESRGMSAERLKHLALAVLNRPDHATARGLLGMVAYQNHWRQPEAVAESIKEDAARSALLAEYNGLRDRMRDTPEDHWELALWCEKHGLKPEMVAHLTTVTRLAPQNEAAWKKLGCRKYRGQWLSPESIAAESAETEAQARADRHWTPLLERWRVYLGDPAHRAEAEAELAGVTDPKAVPAISRLLGKEKSSRQDLAVQLLGQIKAPAASRALALLAVTARNDPVRESAIAVLLQSDPRDFVDALIDMLHAPVSYTVKAINGPGTTGVLFVEGEQFNLRRLYAPPPEPKFSFKPGDMVDYDAYGLPVVTRITGYDEIPVPGNKRLRALAPRAVAIPIGAMAAETLLSAKLAQKQLEADQERVENYNSRVREVNERAVKVLDAVVGENFGSDDPEPWRAWWTDRKGYSYQPASNVEKPTVEQKVALRYMPRSQAQAVTGGVTGYRYRHACFAAGTRVRTLSGSQPIESLRVGDQVLSQDTTTGVLTFQPILAVFHNPPSPTLEIGLGAETIVATGIHRFWRAGKGWTMARELKPGDVLRTVGGLAKVENVSEGPTQPVFNLEVGKNQSFFVGGPSVLVHDNSIVQPTPAPFDAGPGLAIVSPGAGR